MNFPRRKPRQNGAPHRQFRLVRESASEKLALFVLLALALWMVAGPSGLLKWQDYHRMLAERRADIIRLTGERDALKNRVALVDRHHVDPDLAGELLHSNLNVVHPDDKVLLLH